MLLRRENHGDDLPREDRDLAQHHPRRHPDRRQPAKPGLIVPQMVAEGPS